MRDFTSLSKNLKTLCFRTEQIFNQLNTMSSVKESARELIRELDLRMTKLENDRVAILYF